MAVGDNLPPGPPISSVLGETSAANEGFSIEHLRNMENNIAMLVENMLAARQVNDTPNPPVTQPVVRQPPRYMTQAITRITGMTHSQRSNRSHLSRVRNQYGQRHRSRSQREDENEQRSQRYQEEEDFDEDPD